MRRQAHLKTAPPDNIFRKGCFLASFTSYTRSAARFRSLSHPAAHASLGILQSPLGDSATVPTFGPSGRQERLNCWEKNLRQNVSSHR